MMMFECAGQPFGLPVGCIRELRAWTSPTPLPLSDPALLGVINLRGAILPVLDLARRLCLPDAPAPDRPVIMVIEWEGRRAGLRLDRVRDILHLPDGCIEPPDLLLDVSDCLAGFAMAENQPLRILDPARLLPRFAEDDP
jgi:purine-binding chemotaxis protein CheW